MSPRVKSYERDAKALDIAGTLRREGAVIVRELLAPEVVDLIVARLAPHLEKKKAGGGELYGNRTKAFAGLFAREREFSEHLLMNPVVLEVLDATLLPQAPMGTPAETPVTYDQIDYFRQPKTPRDPVLGPNCHHYRLHSAGAIEVWKGGTPQLLHREMDILDPFIAHEPDQPDWVVAVNWAGSDFTADNGATRIGLGSHRWEFGRVALEREVVPAEMPRGSALFWLGRTFHALGANHTDQPRTGIFNIFSANWLSQEENQHLAVPTEMLRTLPEKAQRLLGFRSASVGWVAGRDPENLLRPGDPGAI